MMGVADTVASELGGETSNNQHKQLFTTVEKKPFIFEGLRSDSTRYLVSQKLSSDGQAYSSVMTYLDTEGKPLWESENRPYVIGRVSSETPREASITIKKTEPAADFFGINNPIDYTNERIRPVPVVARAESMPSKQELHVTREVIKKETQRHRHWILTGMIVGMIGLGIKAPDYLGWYDEPPNPIIVQTSAIVEELQTTTASLEERAETLEAKTKTIQAATSSIEQKMTLIATPPVPRQRPTYVPPVKTQQKTYNQNKVAYSPPKVTSPPKKCATPLQPVTAAAQEVKEHYGNNTRSVKTFQMASVEKSLGVDYRRRAEGWLEEPEPYIGFQKPSSIRHSELPQSRSGKAMVKQLPHRICTEKYGRKKCYSQDAKNKREKNTYRELARAYFAVNQ